MKFKTTENILRLQSQCEEQNKATSIKLERKLEFNCVAMSGHLKTRFYPIDTLHELPKTGEISPCKYFDSITISALKTFSVDC